MTTDTETTRATPTGVAGRLRLQPRSLAAAGLDGEALEVYKSDARSRVWRVDHATLGPVVVKQFVYRPVRQRVSLVVGVHPAQLELARNAQLAQSGVPVVPIVDCGEARAGLGGRAWLATRVMGASLQRLLTGGGSDEGRAGELIDAASALTGRLIGAGYTFKDLKPSNIVVDGEGVMRLIDVGSARPDTSGKQVVRMLAVMDRVLKRDGVGRALRERYRDALG
ncbi:MAG: hypothetical protein ACIAXF_02510 [Phycisphaerales bacterium JB063]